MLSFGFVSPSYGEPLIGRIGGFLSRNRSAQFKFGDGSFCSLEILSERDDRRLVDDRGIGTCAVPGEISIGDSVR